MNRDAHSSAADRETPARLDAATAELDPPFGVLDLDALRANAADLVRRAGGKPIRVASKSVRNRDVLRTVLALPGFAGILAYTVAEAIWLGEEFDDVVVGYPSVERAAIGRLGQDERLARRVTLMIDSVEQLAVVEATRPRHPIRVCLELDASLRLFGGRVHLGPRRSPAHAPAELERLARAVLARPAFRLVGIMAYEGQIAGVGDRPVGRPDRALAIRAMQARSSAELAERRQDAVARVRALAELEFVNGGGTGSLHTTSHEEAVTELAAGSGLYAPGIFDHYRAFRARPAALFALAVTRRPGPGLVTVAGGGWVASGPPGPDRLPVPTYPVGLRYLANEAAGEVQTPLAGGAADGLRPGDRVWFRHAKAGELCEHLPVLHALAGDRLVGVYPTYRGEGFSFL